MARSGLTPNLPKLGLYGVETLSPPAVADAPFDLIGDLPLGGFEVALAVGDLAVGPLEVSFEAVDPLDQRRLLVPSAAAELTKHADLSEIVTSTIESPGRLRPVPEGAPKFPLGGENMAHALGWSGGQNRLVLGALGQQFSQPVHGVMHRES